VSSLAPLTISADVGMRPRGIDPMFSDAFSRDYQLSRTDPKRSTYLALATLVRYLL